MLPGTSALVVICILKLVYVLTQHSHLVVVIFIGNNLKTSKNETLKVHEMEQLY
jgi:hypothetical protein